MTRSSSPGNASLLDSLLQDLRFGARLLRRQPAFTATAVVALALGIGPNTVIFGLADAVLWRPLPYADPARLVAVTEQRPRENLRLGPVSPADFLDWRAQARSVTHLAAYEQRAMNLTTGGAPERLRALAVTPGFLEALGSLPALGRAFLPGEERPAESRRVIVSDELWRARFGGAASLPGRSIDLDGVPHEVVGVLPPGFWWTSRPEVLVPLAMTDEERAYRGLHYLGVLGRLAPGASLANAEAELQTIGAALASEHADTNRDHAPYVLPLQDRLVETVRPALVTLLAAAFLVLAIACANVAILIVARAGSREKETAIRLAIGAGRARLSRQFVLESMLLAGLGGAMGLLLAVWSGQSLRALLPAQFASLPGIDQLGVDGRAVLLALALTLLAGLFTGALSARASADDRLLLQLAHDARGGTNTRGPARRAFVVAELALSLMLLIGTGLTLVSLQRVLDVSPGFEPRGVLVADVALPRSRYPDHARTVAFYEGVLRRLAATPGVSASGAVTALPFGGSDARLGFAIEGRPDPAAGPVRAHLRLVTPGYLQAMRIPLRQGRYLEERDDTASPDVVVVNEAAARAYWPGADPIGQRISFGFDEPRWLRIVGVVGDIRHRRLETDPTPEAYLPYLQTHFDEQARAMTIVMRAADRAAASGVLRAAVAEADRDQPAPAIRPLSELIADSIAPRRLSLWLFGAFAGLALLLTAEGLFGVMAFLVHERSREIGVRVALGAPPRHVVGLVLRELLAMSAAGIAVGLGLSLAASRLLASQLYGVAATSPAVYAAAAAALLVVALSAALPPLRRALRVDPIEVLREDA